MYIYNYYIIIIIIIINNIFLQHHRIYIKNIKIENTIYSAPPISKACTRGYNNMY
jgi:hypothetical protein